MKQPEKVRNENGKKYYRILFIANTFFFVPKLLYDCESWFMYQRQIRKIGEFSKRFLLNKIGMNVSNTALLEISKSNTI